MPEIAFHTGVADKPGYVCRLLRKAWRQGRQLVVTGEGAQLDRLDLLLWTFEPGEFLPHLRLRGTAVPSAAQRRTPIWLADDPLAAPTRDVLVNLGPDWPRSHGEFARVVEIVGDDAEEAGAGRERWRRYRAAGGTPELAATTSGSP